ncbi:MAG: hypothetical protein P8177_07270 [Gemmatimonadota bacterium]|jgi:hypothetical protein
MTLLSSRWTFFLKYVFPTIWIGAVGLGTVALWAGLTDDPAPAETKWGLLVVWIAGSLWFVWVSGRLKRVSLEGSELVVSHQHSTIRVPLAAVSEIREARLMNPRLITVRLAHPVESLDKVAFLAPYAFLFPFAGHPLVKELKARVEAAKQTGREDRAR